MPTMSSRKTALVRRGRSRTLIMLVIISVFACGMMYNAQLKDCDLNSVSALITATTLTSWEQLEEQMKNLDPEKAERWRQFLEAEESGSKSAPMNEPKKQPATTTTTTKSLEELEEERVAINSKRVREWRSKFEVAAALPKGDDHRRETHKYTTNAYPVSNLRKCDHVFIDFGSNIGDSLLKLIDSFFPEFDSGYKIGRQAKSGKLHHSLNTTTGNVGPSYYDGYSGNPAKWILPKWVKQNIERYNADKKKNNNKDEVYPEDYCFYGIEGNPHFTSLLRSEEIQVMNMVPRPVRHMHFLTDHVGAGVDGPTTLYLDTINTNENFWGSSVIQSHIDVVASGGNTGVPVMGITLTKLLEQVVLPGGHVMIKIDIEGGEYQLLEEAINSNILCKLTQEQDVQVDMLNEPHDAKIVGSEEPGKRWKAIQGDQKIEKCGVGYSSGDREFR